MTTHSARIAATADAASSACALAAGALATFGATALAFGAGIGVPLVLGSAGGAGLAYAFRGLSRRPEALATAPRRLARAMSAGVRAFAHAFRSDRPDADADAVVEPIRWLSPVVHTAPARALRGVFRRPEPAEPARPSTEVEDLDAALAGLRRAALAGRANLADGLHRLAEAVEPKPEPPRAAEPRARRRWCVADAFGRGRGGSAAQS